MKSSSFILAALALAASSAGPVLAQTLPDVNAPAPRGVTGPITTAVIQEPVTAAEVSATIRPRLLALPGVRGIEQLPESEALLRMLAHNEVGIDLSTLIGRLNAPGADRAKEYDRFEGSVRSLLERTDPFKPAQLRVVVRPTAAIDAFEQATAFGDQANLVVRRPFALGLEEVVVGDTPSTIALMPVARLADLKLGATQAFDLGRTNTAAALKGVKWLSRQGLLEAQAETSYETSLLALDQVWRDLERRLGGPVAVAAPTRGKIVAGRANNARDMARLRAIMVAEAKGDLKLADKVLLRRAGAWAAQ